METTFVQQHCVISGHSMDDIEKELAQIHSHFRTAFGAPRSTPVATPATATRARRTRTAARGTRARARSAPQRLRGTSRTRTGNGHVTDEQMLSAIEGKNGITGKELAAQLGIAHNTALRKLKQWEKQGKAFKQGERNKTRWFARQPAMA